MTKFTKWLSIFGIFSATCIVVIPTATVLTLNTEVKNSSNAPETLKNFQSTLNGDLSNINGMNSIMPSELTNTNFISNVTGFPTIPEGITINVNFQAQSSSSSANGKDDTNGTVNVLFSLSQSGYTLTTNAITINGFQTIVENQFNTNIAISLNSDFIILPSESPNQGVPSSSLPSYFSVKYLNNISSSTYTFSKYQISLISGSSDSINLKIWAYTSSPSNLFAATFVVNGFVNPNSTNGLITQYVNYINASQAGEISFNANIQKLFQENKINAQNFSNENLLTALNISNIPTIKNIMNQTNFKNVNVTINNWTPQTITSTFSITLTNSENNQSLSTSVISIQIPSVVIASTSK